MLRSRSQNSIWYIFSIFDISTSLILRSRDKDVFTALLSVFIREQEAKLVQDRISNVEKHFAELCTTFAAYTRKAARFVYNNYYR